MSDDKTNEPDANAKTREPYEPPAIESSIDIDVKACRECESPIGFCHPACSSQGRD